MTIIYNKIKILNLYFELVKEKNKSYNNFKYSKKTIKNYGHTKMNNYLKKYNIR